MANLELGTKRLCAGCGVKFYDLNKEPIHCPKCGTVYEVVVATRPVRSAGSVAAHPPLPEQAPVPEPQEVEMDETLDGDVTFIEDQEEEDADVTDVIAGNIENKEEA